MTAVSAYEKALKVITQLPTTLLPGIFSAVVRRCVESGALDAERMKGMLAIAEEKRAVKANIVKQMAIPAERLPAGLKGLTTKSSPVKQGK